MANDVPISIGLGSMVSNSAGNSYFGDVSTGADLLWGAPESMARQLELQVLSPIAATGCVAAPAICAGAARGVAVGALLNPNTSAKGHLINGSVGAVIGPLGSAYTRAGGNGAVLRTVNEVKFEVLGWGLGKAASGL